MRDVSKGRVVTYLILLFLFVLKISEDTMVFIHDDILKVKTNPAALDLLGNWIVLLYGFALFGSFFLITIAIALNRDDLQRMNVDQLFIILLSASGLIGLYSLHYNCFSAIAIIYLLYAWLSKKLKFGPLEPDAPRIGLWVLGLFVVGFLLFSGSLNIPKIEQNMGSFLFEVIPFSVFEEAIFRGMLFMFLRDLRFGDAKILYVQAFLFWISHISYLLNTPIWFWIFLPMMGLALGHIALRTKSAGMSAIAHILINTLTVSLSLSW